MTSMFLKLISNRILILSRGFTFKTYCIFFLISFSSLPFSSSSLLWASPCCAGSGGQSVCVLPLEHQYQIGISSSYRSIEGHFDPYGNYTSNPENVSSTSLTTTLGGAYRLNEDWQLSLSFPLVKNFQRFSPQKQESRFGPGDPVLEGRYTLWEDIDFLKFHPNIVFYGGTRFPLGKSVSSDPTGADITGNGSFIFHLGTTLAKLYRPIKLIFDGSFLYPTKKKISQLSSSYALKGGNRIQAQEALSLLINEHFNATLGLKQLWILQTALDGTLIEGSAARFFSSSASLNYFYDATWSFGLSMETPWPFYSYAANQANATAVTLAATYAGF